MIDLKTIPNWLYLIGLMFFVLAAGVADYVHIAPAGSFWTVFLIVLGVLVPSPLPHSGATIVSATVQEPIQAPKVMEGPLR